MRRIALLTMLSPAGCTVRTGPVAVAPAAAAPRPTAVPPGMQYLYGSGEGGAVSIQAWRALVRWAQHKARVRPVDSVVLGEDATLATPAWEPCGAKPLAAVFDNAALAEAALVGVGLGPAVHKQTLWLQGDDNTGGRQDARRWWIADHYCVIAMASDQFGDVSDLFDAALSPRERRAAVSAAPLSAMWGAGWFVTPNPVYGTGLRGGIDDVFPADKRWSPAMMEK